MLPTEEMTRYEARFDATHHKYHIKWWHSADESGTATVGRFKNTGVVRYQKEADGIPLDVCINLWLAKFGSDWVSFELVVAEPIYWDIALRLIKEEPPGVMLRDDLGRIKVLA